MNALEIISELRARNVVPRLVDGKLKLSGNTADLSQEFLRELKERRQVLIDFLSERSSEKETPIEKAEERSAYAMTNAQQRIWVLSQFEGGNEAYNIADAFYLKGQVQLEFFEKAFQIAGNRHESLRTYFTEELGEPVQKVKRSLEFQFEFEEHPNIPSQELKELTRKFNLEVFNLAEAPLFKVKMLKVSEDEHIMLFNMHHIIGDGWSLGVLLQEVMDTYRKLCLKEEEEDISALSVQFKDYSEWLSNRISGRVW